jgi:hypothetical protein
MGQATFLASSALCRAPLTSPGTNSAELTHRATLPACASKGPSQPRKPASTPDLDSERGDGASLMPTSVDDVPREASLAFVSISTCRARSQRGFPFGAAMRRAGVDPWLLGANPGARLTNTL